jgi:phytol kinase
MVDDAASLAAIFCLLLITEASWRKGYIKPEVSRKIIHAVAGTIIAFWPFYMSWLTIDLLSILLLFVVFVSHQFHIFGSIHNVKRSTKGELLYPLGIGLCALFSPPDWIFTAAILHLAWADGLAAVVGVSKWGRKTRYNLWAQPKSLLGSGVFFLASLLIITGSYVFLNHPGLDSITVPGLLAIAVLATLVENVSWYGLDNVTVPLAVLLALSAV